jgi:capsular exopolysaccharide synthesis family protein
VPKTITFTSTLPQEGKTATIANMAVSFAQLGERVLVIDGDLRKHRLHKVFKVRNIVGLSGYLTGKISFEDVIQKTSIENIWLIPSGLHPPNPAELLNSERMKELMSLVKEDFDIVLIDAPPVLAAIDPVIISSFSDSTVFVIRAGKTMRKLFLQAVEEIKKAKSEIIGVIFNEVKIKKDKYYSPYYHYYQKEYYGEYDEQFKKYERKELDIGKKKERKLNDISR